MSDNFKYAICALAEVGAFSTVAAILSPVAVSSKYLILKMVRSFGVFGLSAAAGGAAWNGAKNYLEMPTEKEEKEEENEKVVNFNNN